MDGFERVDPEKFLGGIETCFPTPLLYLYLYAFVLLFFWTKMGSSGIV